MKRLQRLIVVGLCIKCIDVAEQNIDFGSLDKRFISGAKIKENSTYYVSKCRPRSRSSIFTSLLPDKFDFLLSKVVPQKSTERSVYLSTSSDSWYFAAIRHVTNSSDASGQFMCSLRENVFFSLSSYTPWTVALRALHKIIRQRCLACVCVACVILDTELNCYTSVTVETLALNSFY